MEIHDDPPTSPSVLLGCFIYVSWSTTDVLYLNFPHRPSHCSPLSSDLCLFTSLSIPLLSTRLFLSHHPLFSRLFYPPVFINVYRNLCPSFLLLCSCPFVSSALKLYSYFLSCLYWFYHWPLKTISFHTCRFCWLMPLNMNLSETLVLTGAYLLRKSTDA